VISCARACPTSGIKNQLDFLISFPEFFLNLIQQ